MGQKQYSFEESELKALVYLCCGEAIFFHAFEAMKYDDEVLARKQLEDNIMKIVDDALCKKV